MTRWIGWLSVWCLLAPCVWAAAPSRTQTYTAGEVIKPAEVTENEDNVYSYLQAGVDTIANNAVLTNHIKNGEVGADDLATSSVTSAKILDGTVSSTDIADGTIVGDDLVDNTLDAEELDETDDYTWTGTHDFGGGAIEVQNQGDCSGVTTEGRACWDSDDEVLYFGNGASAQAIFSTGTPGLTFGTANTAGTAVTGLATDATLAIFNDGATPDPLGTAAAGTDAYAARRDHVHLQPETTLNTIQETIIDGQNGTDVSVTCTTDCYALVTASGAVNDGTPCTSGTINVSLRRGGVVKAVSGFDPTVDDNGFGVQWAESLTANTYAYDILFGGCTGESSILYDLSVLTVDQSP